VRQAEELAARHREFISKLAERQSLMLPADDPDYEDFAPAFSPWPAKRRQPILQPPKPDIIPSQQVLDLIADRDLDWEAAD
jgi:hypothetical protein